MRKIFLRVFFLCSYICYDVDVDNMNISELIEFEVSTIRKIKLRKSNMTSRQ